MCFCSSKTRKVNIKVNINLREITHTSVRIHIQFGKQNALLLEQSTRESGDGREIIFLKTIKNKNYHKPLPEIKSNIFFYFYANVTTLNIYFSQC